MNEGSPNDAALYAIAYIFLCRVGAELLPAVVQLRGNDEIMGEQAVLIINEKKVITKLARRKNESKGRYYCSDVLLRTVCTILPSTQNCSLDS